MRLISDPVEKVIASALDDAGIPYRHDSDGAALDFELPNGILIECKRFGTERTRAQIEPYPDVILVQGLEAARYLARLIRAARLG